MTSGYKTTSLGWVLGLTLFASPAFAAGTYMLQFGSYQSAEEAREHLNELKSKHVGALSRLNPSVRPVTLPPDDLTVYRTQAGPLATRADAQSVCSQLVSNGDECYVVEASSATAKNTAPSVHVRGTPAMVNPLAPATVTTTARPIVPTEPLPPANLPQPGVATTVVADATATENAVRQALDDAAVKQQTRNESGTETSAPQRSFWDRINPFSDSTEDAVPAPTAAPVEPVQTQSITAPEFPLPPPATIVTINPVPVDMPNIPPATLPEEATDFTPPSPVAPPVSLGAIPPAASAPTATASLYSLPPPPPPLPAATPPTPIVSTPLPTTVPTATSIDSRPLAPPAGLLSATHGNVRVEEAKRVPVTLLPPPPIVVPITPPSPSLSAPPTVPTTAINLSPNATLGQRTLWAQIGQFRTTQQALAFWNNYRRTHPDFPVVRVRVTSPLAKHQHQLSSVNLRIGPFARPEFVTNLCASLTPQDRTPEAGMQCGVIADLGVAVNPHAPAYQRYRR